MGKIKKILIIIFLIIPVLTIIGEDIILLYKCVNFDTKTNEIRFDIQIVNDRNSAIVLKDLHIRYYYSLEPQSQVYHVDYAAFGSSNVICFFDNTRNNDHYFDITFTQGAGSLSSFSFTGVVQLRFSSVDFSVLYQSDDYSFNPQSISLSPNNKIALFYKGELVWGIVPYGINPTPVPVL